MTSLQQTFCRSLKATLDNVCFLFSLERRWYSGSPLRHIEEMMPLVTRIECIQVRIVTGVSTWFFAIFMTKKTGSASGIIRKVTHGWSHVCIWIGTRHRYKSTCQQNSINTANALLWRGMSREAVTQSLNRLCMTQFTTLLCLLLRSASRYVPSRRHWRGDVITRIG